MRRGRQGGLVAKSKWMLATSMLLAIVGMTPPDRVSAPAARWNPRDRATTCQQSLRVEALMVCCTLADGVDAPHLGDGLLKRYRAHPRATARRAGDHLVGGSPSRRRSCRWRPAPVSASRPISAPVSASRPTAAVASASRPIAAPTTASRPTAAPANGSRPPAAPANAIRHPVAPANASRPTAAYESASRPNAAPASASRPNAAPANASRPTEARARKSPSL